MHRNVYTTRGNVIQTRAQRLCNVCGETFMQRVRGNVYATCTGKRLCNVYGETFMQRIRGNVYATYTGKRLCNVYGETFMQRIRGNVYATYTGKRNLDFHARRLFDVYSTVLEKQECKISSTFLIYLKRIYY